MKVVCSAGCLGAKRAVSTVVWRADLMADVTAVLMADLTVSKVEMSAERWADQKADWWAGCSDGSLVVRWAEYWAGAKVAWTAGCSDGQRAELKDG